MHERADQAGRPRKLVRRDSPIYRITFAKKSANYRVAEPPKKTYASPISRRTTNTNAKPPQNGRVTYHQDQSINPVSFRVTKTTPSKPSTPTPLFEVEVLSLITQS